ncbi:MAG: choice-of-anchor P family protein [Labedaea sp.]
MELRRRGLAIALALVSVVVFGQVPASADPPPPPPPPPPPTANQPSGTGSVGSAAAVIDGSPISIADLAVCETDGVETGFTPGVQADLVRIGWGFSHCSTDGRGDVTVRVVGSLYEIDAAIPQGGPQITAAYEVTCQATPSNTWSTLRVSPIPGIWLPARIPPNYTVVIPGRLTTDSPLARIVFNEQIREEPPDRTLTMNAVHVHLFPDGPAANRGEFIAGTVRCSSHTAPA